MRDSSTPVSRPHPRRKPRPRSPYFEFLEARTLLSFTGGDMSGAWSYLSPGAQGSITFDDANAITTGSLDHDDASHTTPTGSYAINSDGTLSISAGSSTYSGAMTGTKDVIAAADTASQHSLSLLIMPRAASFSDADLSGTWSFGLEGDDPGANGFGAMSFDGAGNVTGGTTISGDDASTITAGNYTMNADGTCTLALQIQHSDLSIDNAVVYGALNASKDVLAFNPPDLSQAASNNSTRLVVAIRSSGAYTDADLSGAWIISGDNSTGIITFDGTGNIFGGLLNSGGQRSQLRGTYTVDASGSLTVNLNQITAGVGQAVTFTGALNASRNLVIMNFTNASFGDSLAVLVSSPAHVNLAPSLTTISTLATAQAGNAFNIPQATLAAAGNQSDPEGDPLQFQITSVDSGSLRLNGTPVTTFPALVNVGDTLTWTPASGAHGDIDAFSVKIFDGHLASASAIPVMVTTTLPGAFSNADLNNTWIAAGTGLSGSLLFDGAGNITDGTLTDASGNTFTPAGNYSVNANASVILAIGATSNAGGLNSARDVLAFTQDDLDDSLTLLVNSGSGAFDDSALNGSWNLEFDGSTPASNGSGAFLFDGNGAITGSITTGSGAQSIANGNYNVNADGTCAISFDVQGAGTLNFTGALNASGDFIALSPTDLPAAVSGDLPLLAFLVRNSGAYSNADVAGTWFLATEGGSGTIILDGAGHITGGAFTDDSGQASTISGTYSVKSNGSFTVNLVSSVGAVHQPLTETGFINASHTIMVQNQIGAATSDNLSILLNAANHAPTLTAVFPFTTAIAGQAFSLSYDDLLHNSNAHDPDNNTLQFQVTAVNSGALHLNGNDVTTFPTFVGPGDVLAWTPPPSTAGLLSAFSVKVFDGLSASASAVNVSINTLLGGSHSVSDVHDAWTLTGLSSQGALNFDGAGNFTANLTDDSGNSDSPTGAYAISPTGALTVSPDGSGSSSGAISPTNDFAAISDDGGLNVLINSQDADFANSDLNGTWTVAFDGLTPGSNGVGTVVFNGAGLITGGTVTAGAHTFHITGNYTANADGAIAASLTNTSSGDTITLHGAMNNSKDIVSMSADDLQAAEADDTPLLMLFVRSAGSYSNADAKGTWLINGDNTTGFVVLDGAGHISGGTLHAGAGASGLGGTYTVASNGKITLNIQVTIGGVPQTFSLIGGLNASRNAIAANHTGAGSDDNLTLFINPAGHAPTLTTIAPFATAVDNQTFDISFEQLLAASNAADLDGGALQFLITSEGAGTFTLDSNPAPATPFIFSAGQTLHWIPALGAKGNVAAFTVRAFDGVNVSAAGIPVLVKTLLAPTVSIAANKNKASETNNGATTGIGQYTVSRTNGDPTQPLTVNFTLSGTALNPDDYTLTSSGAPLAGNYITIPATKTSITITLIPVDDAIAEPTETAILTLATNSAYIVSPVITKAAATVSIADNEPIISIAATKNTASELNNGATTGIGLFTFSRTGPTTGSLTITYSIGGTATNGADYNTTGGLPLSGTLTFQAGSATATLLIIPVNDGTPEPTETLLLTLATGSAYTVNPILTKSTATVKILNH